MRVGETTRAAAGNTYHREWKRGVEGEEGVDGVDGMDGVGAEERRREMSNAAPSRPPCNRNVKGRLRLTRIKQRLRTRPCSS